MNVIQEPSEKAREIAIVSLMMISSRHVPAIRVWDPEYLRFTEGSGFFVTGQTNGTPDLKFRVTDVAQTSGAITLIAKWLQAIPVNTPGIVLLPPVDRGEGRIDIHIARGFFYEDNDFLGAVTVWERLNKSNVPSVLLRFNEQGAVVIR